MKKSLFFCSLSLLTATACGSSNTSGGVVDPNGTTVDTDGSVIDSNGTTGSTNQTNGGTGGTGGAGGTTGGTGGTTVNGGAGGTTADGVLPNPYTRVNDSDTAVSESALSILKTSCGSCHSMSQTTLTSWREMTNTFEHDCINEAVNVADCVAEKNTSLFSPNSLGIFAAATKLPWLQYVAAHAPSLGGLDTQAGMPRSGAPLTQDQFDVVHEWFARGLVGIDALIPLDTGASCTSYIDPELLTRIATMKTSGWRAMNEQVPLLMLGCGPGQAGKTCLTNFTNAASTVYGSGWAAAGSTIRILRDNSSTPSNYWTRSSADGKFMGSGSRTFDANGFNGSIVNIETGHVVKAKFDYDATFFPDNSGILLQRGGYDDGSDFAPTDGSVSSQAVAVVCNQSVLSNDPATLSGTESGCSLINGKIGLYQQLSRSVSGSDYWAVFGSYQSDNSGFSKSLEDPSAAFPDSAKVTFVRMLNNGTSFSAGDSVAVSTPHMGDPASSPSGELFSMRIAGGESVDTSGGVHAPQAGYAIYSINTATSQIKEQANICKSGGKATFSYDERWMVFHHYVNDGDAQELGFTGTNDPSFADYRTKGSSNVYLVDLKTGVTTLITHMKAGQYALFPHFRSDGWIQFIVRTVDDDEWFVSSDAALVRE